MDPPGHRDRRADRLAIVVIAALFLLPYLRGDSVVPFGFDTAHYIWRANVTIADGLDALRTFAPELNANAERPAFPVLASLIDAAGGPSPYLLAFLTPAVFATAVGLAAGSFAVDVLEEPPWAFAVFAIVVGGSLAVVRTAVGSLDALLVESVVLAGGGGDDRRRHEPAGHGRGDRAPRRGGGDPLGSGRAVPGPARMLGHRVGPEVAPPHP